MMWPSAATARHTREYLPGASCSGARTVTSGAGEVGSGASFCSLPSLFFTASAVRRVGSENFSTMFGGETATVLPSAGTESLRWVWACAFAANKANTAATVHCFVVCTGRLSVFACRLSVSGLQGFGGSRLKFGQWPALRGSPVGAMPNSRNTSAVCSPNCGERRSSRNCAAEKTIGVRTPGMDWGSMRMPRAMT